MIRGHAGTSTAAGSASSATTCQPPLGGGPAVDARRRRRPRARACPRSPPPSAGRRRRRAAPLLVTTICSRRPLQRSSTAASTPSPACLSALVSASWTIRYAASCRPSETWRGRRAGDGERGRQRRPRGPARPARRAAPMPGCGARLAGPLVVAQHAEQPAHLGQRLAAGAGSAAHRDLARCSGIVVDRVGGAVGERDHHREVVGDDVVHLARDPRALGGGGEPALLVALGLQSRGALAQRRQQRLAVADVDAQHARRRWPGRTARRTRPAGGRAGAQRSDRQHDPDLEHRGGRQRGPQRLRRGDRVERDEQRGVAERAGRRAPTAPARSPRSTAKTRDRARAGATAAAARARR